MKSTIKITPISNIVDGCVVDNTLILTSIHDTDMDVFVMYNNGKLRKGNLMQVSLYDDLLVIDNIHYKILHMLSK